MAGFDVGGLGELLRMMEQRFGRRPVTALLVLSYAAIVAVCLFVIWTFIVKPTAGVVDDVTSGASIDWAQIGRVGVGVGVAWGLGLAFNRVMVSNFYRLERRQIREQERRAVENARLALIETQNLIKQGEEQQRTTRGLLERAEALLDKVDSQKTEAEALVDELDSLKVEAEEIEKQGEQRRVTEAEE